MQEGPKLETFYNCVGCKHLYIKYVETSSSVSYNSPACRRLDRELNNELSFDSHEECLTYVKTPVDCPLLGKTKEEEFDVRFDKHVLMRNL